MRYVDTVLKAENVSRVMCEREVDSEGDMEILQECKLGIDTDSPYGGLSYPHETIENVVSVDASSPEYVKNGSIGTRVKLDQETCEVTTADTTEFYHIDCS